jgi:hypothetical protein
LLLAACGSLRIACEPIAVNLAWNLIFGINHQTFAQVQRSTLSSIAVRLAPLSVHLCEDVIRTKGAWRCADRSGQRW